MSETRQGQEKMNNISDLHVIQVFNILSDVTEMTEMYVPCGPQ